ncbi:MAG: diguanylate cyclase, partial [Acetatifactor sp.]|nr:diguanylate cyclase [Acetatifactor sp.]
MSVTERMDEKINLADLQENGGREAVDALTTLCTFSVAKEQINELMRRKPQGIFHVVLLYVGNISQLTEEYGFAFTMAVLENQAILLRRYFQLLDEAVLCRIGKDAMMAFVQWEDSQEVEEHCRSVQEKLQNRYFGRREKLRCRLTMGVYHVPPQERELRQLLACGGKAVAYGLRCRIPFVVYEESMADEAVRIDESMTTEKMAEERLMQYDSRFISFAVTLLSDTMDLDSSLDMLVKQVGLHFGYDEVLISEFIQDNSTMVS